MAETEIIDQVIEDVSEIKADIRQMDGRLFRLEEGMGILRETVARLSGTVDQLSLRVGNLEQTMRQMQASLDRVIGSQLSSQRWLVGLILGTWLTTILTILLKTG